MQFPTISQYAGSVGDPVGLTRTLGEFYAERDNYGEVRIRTGNNACVFRISTGGPPYMLKCYIRPRSDLASIYDYISRSRDALFPCIGLLPGELYVFDHFGEGDFYDVVCGEWVHGVTLDTEIRRVCRAKEKERLELLSASFDKLAYELLKREWAHGDLKTENIIVRPDGTMKLIDFDALYFPGNPSPSYSEVGTPGYQHPSRNEELYDKCVDDYPLALISSSLKALAVDPSLYRRFNRSDMLLMNPAAVLGGTCPAYPEVKETLAASGCFGHYRLLSLLRSPVPRIAGLAEVFGRIVTPEPFPAEPDVYVRDGLCGYSAGDPDSGGAVVTEPVFDEACRFTEGVALVSINGTRRLLSDGGEYLFPDLFYDDIKPFSDGLAAFRSGGLWGFVSRDGTVAIEPAYEAAGNMHCGAAPVRKNGLWAYVSRDGDLLTDFVYDKAFGFRNGVAEAWRGGQVCRIRINNNIISREKG